MLPRREKSQTRYWDDEDNSNNNDNSKSNVNIIICYCVYNTGTQARGSAGL